jgi:hypothetical protein
MLGKLKMTTKEALTYYIRIMERVFSPSNKKRTFQDGAFKVTTLETEIKAMIAAKGEDKNGDERMIGPKDSTSFA